MQKSKVQLIFWLLLADFVIVSDGQRQLDITGIVVRLERITCACGDDCTFKLCKTKFVSRHVVTANVVLVLKTKVTEWRDYVKTYYKFSNNEYRPMGIHTGYDFCASQEGLIDSPLNALVIRIIGNHTNWNKKCPFSPGEYYIKDLNLQAAHLPNLVPAGRYKINFSSYIQSNKWLYNASIYASVSNYGIQDMNMG